VPDSIGRQLDAYLVAVGDVQKNALLLAEQLRDNCPGVRLQSHCGGGSFKNQMKKADKSGAQIALILGEDEVALGRVTVKNLRENHPQQTIPLEEVAACLKGLIG